MQNAESTASPAPGSGADLDMSRKARRPKRSASRAAADSPGVPCPHCHLWENAPADTYCGFCGRLLLDLAIRPERALLISGLAPRCELVIANRGARPLEGILVPGARALPGLIVEPATAFSLPAGEEVRVQLRLDEERLPLDLMAEDLSYTLMIDNDPHQTVPVPIAVKAGPRPVVLPPALQFGELAEGSQAVRQLELRNQGGIPLRVREVQAIGSVQLGLVGAPSFPVVVAPGEQLALRVEWDTRRTGPAAGAEDTGLRVSFDNYAQTLFVPVTARLFRFALALEPKAIRISPTLAKQDYIQTVTVTNTGSIDVEIAGIESDQPWIEVVAKAKSFTLRHGEPAASGHAAPLPGEVFTVVCHPQKLAAGLHRGRVAVVPVGQARQELEVELNVIHPKASPDYLGIDFGTSNSVIAFYNYQLNAPDVVQVARQVGPRVPLIPSVLAFIGGPETYKIGDEALSEFRGNPNRGVRSIKRIMGYDHEREFFGRSFSPEQLAAKIIEKLVQLAEERYYEVSQNYLSFDKAIVTVPANFFDRQIRGVLEACKMAGLDTEEEAAREAALTLRAALGKEVNAGVIIDEPSAAALHYLELLQTQGRLDGLGQETGKRSGLNLLVFDYGGGTLDVSVANVVRMGEGGAGLSVLANMGNNRVGGESIDLMLMREMLERCLGEVDFDASLISSNFNELENRSRVEGWFDTLAWLQVLAARGVWKDAAEAVKVQLSKQEQASFEVGAEFILRIVDGGTAIGKDQKTEMKRDRPFSTVVVRAHFESWIEGTLVECLALVDSALKLAEVAPNEIDYVLHTGRQSLTPAVRRRVKESFPDLPPGNDLLEDENVKVCVAKGAVLYGLLKASNVAGDAGVQFLNEGHRLPHSYGIEKTRLALREFDQIIPRGATYPRVEDRTIPESRIKGGPTLNLKFYQNTGTGTLMKGNPEISLIGQITVNTLANGKPGADVRFMIDANRKLEVSVDGRAVDIQPVRLQGEETWWG